MEILFGALKFVTVLLLPVVVTAVAERIAHAVASDDFKTVPILQHLSKLHGLVIGGALIYTNFSGRYFDLEKLFLTDSPWSISFRAFITERSNVFSYSLEPILSGLAHPNVHPELAAVCIAAFLLPVICAAFAFKLWPAPIAWRALAACAIQSLLTVWATVYLVALTFWGLYLLNFWALALIAAYYQYRRYHTGHA